MTAERRSAIGREAVDAAFNRVLRAEQQAREAIDACRRQAQAELADAERTAREIAQRTDRRIRDAHRIADLGIGRRLARIAETRTGTEPETDFEAERVDALAALLAAELTGSES